MAAYIVNRVLAAFITLLAVITITFFLMQAVPGSPFLGDKPRPEVEAAMSAKYGLDRPVIVQFKNYVEHMLQGDLGVSLKMKVGQPVTDLLISRFPISARIGTMAFIIAVLLGIPIGVFTALRSGRFIDRLVVFFCSIGVSLPNFVVVAVLIYIFGVQLKLLPTLGLDSWMCYLMPVFCLTYRTFCFLIRLTRSNMLDVINQDYIKTARAKGLFERTVLFKHALRNAVIPVVTYLGPEYIGIITGSFIVEKLFTIPGLSRYFVLSINARDYPIIMGTTILFGAFLILANFIVDMLYGVIDPRIRRA